MTPVGAAIPIPRAARGDSMRGAFKNAERARAGMFAFACGTGRSGTCARPRPARREAALLRAAARPGSPFLFGIRAQGARSNIRGSEPDIDRGALSLFAALIYVPAPLSIYRGIGKLPPGTILTLVPGRSRTGDRGILVRGRKWPRRASPTRSTRASEAAIERAGADRSSARSGGR